MKYNINNLRISGATFLLSVVLPQTANAQSQIRPESQTGAGEASQDIIVTANKREEALNRVGLTITALSGDVLTERKLTSLADITSVVPGLSFAQSNLNTPVLSLRGVGYDSAALGSYPAVSVYIDQVPLPFPVLASHAAYDLQRVEVLKGPQGTLFGQNATGGAINFVPAKPTKTFEGGADISYGRFSRAESNFYLSGPIANDLRARISGNFVSSEGWQVSQTRPGDRNGAQHYGAGRLLLDWDASDRLRFSLNVNGWIDRSQPQAGQFIAVDAQARDFISPGELAAVFTSNNARAADWNNAEYRPRGNRKLVQAALRTDFDLSGDLTATSLTSYVHFKQNQTADADGLPISITDYIQDGYINSFNQEIRLANSAANSLRWVLGGNYESSKTWDFQDQSFADSSAGNNPGTGFIKTSKQYEHQSIENIAAFGNVEFDISSSLVAKGGIRYTKSRNNAYLCTGDRGDGLTAPFFNFLASLFATGSFTPAGAGDCVTINFQGVPTITPTYLTLKEDNVSWRVGIDYKATPGTLVYANISRGYKAGSFPLLPATSLTSYNPVTQESVISYEAGVKSDLLGRKLHIDVAGFYYDYRDKQVTGRANDPIFRVQNALVNVPKSRVFGVDSSISLRPSRGLTLTGSLLYLKSKILRYAGLDAFGVPQNLAGNRLPFAPTWSYSADIDYRFKMSTGGTPFVGVSVAGRAEQDVAIAGSKLTLPNVFGVRVAPGVIHPLVTNPYATVDLRLGYEAADGAWKVIAFGKNVLNKYYWNSLASQNEIYDRFAAMPATYGVTLGVKFR
ncbi:MAG: TonB-dependent receptor [Sphingobium sp.]